MKYPPPLEGREVIETYHKLLAGEKYAYEDFIEGHMRLASSIANAHCPVSYWLEDMISESLVALVEGVNRLRRQDEHPNPIGYLISVIRGRVIDFLRKQPPIQIELPENLESADGYKQILINDQIESLLPEPLQEVLYLKLANYSESEIATHLGLSRSTVARHRRQIANLWRELAS